MPITLGLSIQKVMQSFKSSKVSIYFKGADFVSSRRGELFGMTDFVANCGGILGFCLGVSFVSLVELLYYCVARPLMVVRSSADQRRIIMVEEREAERY
ncbi:pickpocket [Culex quinquefasciatus]|uniref:Pickpocket n=1 Tax=Culex quinquefasciatus TaxID=7176 RepID=B0WDC7_CULQU|nr:pickpocket [Culex quinquefasciatus]|eukprot:XP_001846711.1 pickpocket [Culex quinquefasciatus]